jgi:multiple sugar transport system permease protein
MRAKWLPWILIAPTALFALAMTVLPLGYSLWMSLRDFPLGKPSVFAGLMNFNNLLHDRNFHSSLGTTLVYTVAATGIEFMLGLALALLLEEEFSFQGVIRSSLIIPMVIAPVVVGIIWRLLYNADVGLFSFAVKVVTGKSLSVLSSTSLALPALILVDVWEWTPFMFLILLAGIQSLPREPFEAARVDGAGPWNVFVHLTLPMLRPVILVAILIRALDAFTVFDQVFVLTQGGPGTSTEVATLMIYKTAFRFSQFGYGAAMAVSVLILLTCLSAAMTQAFKGRD